MLALGVTGHRCLAEVCRVEAGIDEALRRIREAFGAQPVTVVSALAEGADRLVARRILAHPDTRLVVPLPLPRGEYVKDFASGESVHEFTNLLACADEVIELPSRPTRNESYRAAGLYVLDHCDVLIAVWDGKEGETSSGTGAMVTEARRRGMPIAWVHASNRQPGTNEPTSLGEEQGVVTLENFEVQR